MTEGTYCRGERGRGAGQSGWVMSGEPGSFLHQPGRFFVSPGWLVPKLFIIPPQIWRFGVNQDIQLMVLGSQRPVVQTKLKKPL